MEYGLKYRLYPAVSSALKPMSSWLLSQNGFVFECAAAAEVERIDAALGIFFARVVHDFGAALDFVWTIFECFNDDVQP